MSSLFPSDSPPSTIPERERDGFTHSQLVKRAGAWLRGTIRCSVVFEEHTSGFEHPDAFGFKGSYDHTWMVECKVSRSDFYADKKKPSRRAGFEQRAAFQCYYLVPKGLIQPESVPAGWGLLYAEARRIIVVKFAEPRSRHHDEPPSRWANPLREGFPHDDRSDLAKSIARNLLYQEVRRYQVQGIRYKSGVELFGAVCAGCGVRYYPGQPCKSCDAPRSNPTPALMEDQ